MKEKTVTMSIRISERAADALHEEAKLQNVSVNTLTNQILLTFADYDRFTRKFHVIKIASATLRRVIDAATEKAIEEAGRFAGSNVPTAFILAKMGELNVENALESLRELGTYGGMFEYSESTNQQGNRIVTLAHNLGPKGSIFLQHHVESLLAAVGKKVKVVRFDDAITAEIQ